MHMTLSDQQSAERRTPDQEPTYSLTELCRSWAEVTGESWQSILYRFSDWAITIAFPEDAFLDDTFLSANRGDTTFHKKIIFDRVQWHRDLVDKIRRVQDPNEKARLQRFADIHMKTLETAVMRRDVLMEACRAMNVAPPPILGLVEGVSAEHPVPPERPLHSPVGVFAREADRDQELLRHRNVMPADEAEGHTLLWDAAAEISRNNGRSLERNWLRLMDAFWRGELSSDGRLVYFYPGLPGREHVELDRTALAGSLLGHRDLDTAAANIENLRQWAVADYLGQPAPFDFFRKNPEGRFGLAVLTRDLDRWHQGPAELRSDAGRIAPGSDADQRQPHPQPQQDAFRAWCERKYPNGITTDIPVKSLSAEYNQDTGLIVSPSSIRRALGRKQ
jgi:hypothetical protein